MAKLSFNYTRIFDFANLLSSRFEGEVSKLRIMSSLQMFANLYKLFLNCIFSDYLTEILSFISNLSNKFNPHPVIHYPNNFLWKNPNFQCPILSAVLQFFLFDHFYGHCDGIVHLCYST